MPRVGVLNEFVGEVRVGEGLGEPATVLFRDQVIVLAYEEQDATGDARGGGEGGFGLAERDVGGRDPAAVDDDCG